MLVATLTSHFMEKSPLKQLIVRCLFCFNPIVLAGTNKHEASRKQFGKVMEKLLAAGHFKSKDADEAKDQYEKMLEELVPKYREEFVNFDIFANRLDDFIIPLLSAKKLDILSKVYILIFCLNHGQSAVERGFSMNKEYIKENRSENCLVSLRIIHNHLTSKKVTASSIIITADMIKSTRSARLRYEQFQLETSKEKKATEKQLKRRIITNELEQVKQKKSRLEESVCELVKDAHKLSLDAEEKNYLMLLSRSNVLRKLANCKR